MDRLGGDRPAGSSRMHDASKAEGASAGTVGYGGEGGGTVGRGDSALGDAGAAHGDEGAAAGKRKRRRVYPALDHVGDGQEGASAGNLSGGGTPTPPVGDPAGSGGFPLAGSLPMHAAPPQVAW